MQSFSRFIINLLKTIWLAARYFAVIVKYYIRNAWGCSKLFKIVHRTICYQHFNGSSKSEWCTGLRTKSFRQFLSHEFGKLVYLCLAQSLEIGISPSLIVDITSIMRNTTSQRHYFSVLYSMTIKSLSIQRYWLRSWCCALDFIQMFKLANVIYTEIFSASKNAAP